MFVDPSDVHGARALLRGDDGTTSAGCAGWAQGIRSAWPPAPALTVVHALPKGRKFEPMGNWSDLQRVEGTGAILWEQASHPLGSLADTFASDVP